MNRVYLEKTGTPVWLYYFVGIMQLPILVIFLVNMYSNVSLEDPIDGVLIALSVFVFLMFAGIFWVLTNLKLEIRIADRSLSYRFPPFVRKKRTYSFEEIEHWELVEKSFITVGIGLRFDPRSKARIYSTGTNKLLSLKLASGKHIMLSIKNPEEITRALQAAERNKDE